MAQLHAADAGRLQNIGWRWSVPETLTVQQNMRFQVEMWVGIETAYAGGEDTDTVFHYRVNNKTPGANATYSELLKSFSSADGFTAKEFKKARWVMRADRFTGAPGGRVEIWFEVSETSTGPRFVFGEPMGIWLPDAPGVVATEGFFFM